MQPESIVGHASPSPACRGAEPATFWASLPGLIEAIRDANQVWLSRARDTGGAEGRRADPDRRSTAAPGLARSAEDARVSPARTGPGKPP